MIITNKNEMPYNNILGNFKQLIIKNKKPNKQTIIFNRFP